jgi:hypothetical protein
LERGFDLEAIEGHSVRSQRWRSAARATACRTPLSVRLGGPRRLQ